MAVAVASPPLEPHLLRKQMLSQTHTHTCPNCGTPYVASQNHNGGDSKGRIAELESQVKILTEKATTAVDKLADYEDELRLIKSTHKSQSSADSGVNIIAEAQSSEETRPGTANSSAKPSRFSFLPGRRGSPAQNALPIPGPPTPSSARESDLQAQLAKEQKLRQQAESKVKDMSGEIEDLSVTLFQQANEMVANERKARAKLEERVEVLEKRDREKRKRLEKLEMAMKRIERVRGLLAT